MKTAWVVWLYILLYATLLILQTTIEFIMPMDGATWALLAVVGGYVGFDQFATFVASKKMPVGVKYTGSYTKLRNIVIAMFFLVILAIVVQGIKTDVPLPLDELTLAAGVSAGLFAGGNKAANAAEKEVV